MFDFIYFDTEQQQTEPYIYFFHMIIKGLV